MKNTLGWGLMSTARINQAVIPPLRVSSRNQLIAVGSRDPAKAEAYAKEWSIPRAHGSYEALLADPEIDVVYISLPNSLHVEWAVKAAQAGKHVLCEKPLAISLEQMDAITTAARQNGVIVMEAFMYRHHPQTHLAQKLVASGALGKVFLIRGSFSFHMDYGDDVRWVPGLGGGSLWDVGCYPVSFARTIFQAEPQEVFGWQVVGQTGIDDVFAGQLRFPDGSLAQIESNFRSESRSSIEIVGDAGSLAISKPFKPYDAQVMHLKQGECEEKVPVPAFDPYIGEVENMADAILNGAAPCVSLEDSRGNVVTLLALLESARTGKVVRL